VNLLLPILATLIWAGSTVVNRLSVGTIEPAAISFYRWLTALLVLTPVVLPRTWRVRHEARPHLHKLFVLGVLGMSLYQSLAYFAAHTVTATSMGLILASMPLLTMLLAAPILGTRPTWEVVVGALISFFGLAWLISGGDLSQLWQQGMGRGEAMMLLASLSYSLYCVLVKRWRIPLPTWESLYIQIFFGTLVLIPAFVMAPRVRLTAENLPLVLFAGLFASALAPGLWMRGLNSIGAEKTAVLMNLVPLFTAVLALLMLGEQMHHYHFVGGALILGGIALAQLRTFTTRGAVPADVAP
jgi:drug/metabolite transporter (DMT)-like permease